MDFSFLFQLLIFSPLIIGPALLYLILRRIFKVKSRVSAIAYTLMISLIATSSIPVILSQNLYSFVHPWTNCIEYGSGDSCKCPENAECVCSGLGLLLCKAIQIYEWVLIIVSLMLMAIFLLYARLKKGRKKGKCD